MVEDLSVAAGAMVEDVVVAREVPRLVAALEFLVVAGIRGAAELVAASPVVIRGQPTGLPSRKAPYREGWCHALRFGVQRCAWSWWSSRGAPCQFVSAGVVASPAWRVVERHSALSQRTEQLRRVIDRTRRVGEGPARTRLRRQGHERRGTAPTHRPKEVLRGRCVRRRGCTSRSRGPIPRGIPEVQDDVHTRVACRYRWPRMARSEDDRSRRRRRRGHQCRRGVDGQVQSSSRPAGVAAVASAVVAAAPASVALLVCAAPAILV